MSVLLNLSFREEKAFPKNNKKSKTKGKTEEKTEKKEPGKKSLCNNLTVHKVVSCRLPYFPTHFLSKFTIQAGQKR